MGDETPNAMNLDLNLGPSPSPDNELGSGSLSNESVNLGDWIDRQPYNRHRETLRLRPRQRLRSYLQPVSIPPETRNIALELMINFSNGGGGGLQTGEGNVSSEGRNDEAIKTCENNVTHEGNDILGKMEDEEKGNGEEGSLFDCNICLDLARNPVVTCCGHLFCWPCLYRWLHVHSDAKECPVCKGKVAIKNLTPIYGRGNSIHEPEEDPTLKIPARPQARRIESWRQTIRRNAFTIPMEEMIRRLGSGFDLTRELVQVQPQNTDSVQDPPERNNSFLNRILTLRGMRREQNTVIPQEDLVDVGLTPSSSTNSDVGESHRFSSPFRRSHAHRAATISNLTSALSSAERLVESYFHYHHAERNQEQSPPVDDRDSVSSIAAVIHSESQMVDTAIEIDSTVSLSTLSSRRRNDASRVSDMDSGESRAYRRRRLN
ncbi:E3 ubiquitin-protein like [Actinidia chinensis var. chinensis]|uniref:E3 ubiquitin-protein ligase RMA n=1 Tax=Actinidia chinensis var. chinensis TaxID=1590841 RepID=A0A2R6QRQ2_ACTCC|nr:E3 ubiquitin-protein like [Actinidia chinensis var. chinensis]